MLFNEFVAGTGCRETEKNYQIYKELEIIYMNTDCSKEHIYEMGKKLVDNSKTEEELRIEAEVKAEIESHKRTIEIYKKELEWKNESIEIWKDDDKEWAKQLRAEAKFIKEQIKFERNRINALKWVLA